RVGTWVGRWGMRCEISQRLRLRGNLEGRLPAVGVIREWVTRNAEELDEPVRDVVVLFLEAASGASRVLRDVPVAQDAVFQQLPETVRLVRVLVLEAHLRKGQHLDHRLDRHLDVVPILMSQMNVSPCRARRCGEPWPRRFTEVLRAVLAP